ERRCVRKGHAAVHLRRRHAAGAESDRRLERSLLCARRLGEREVRGADSAGDLGGPHGNGKAHRRTHYLLLGGREPSRSAGAAAAFAGDDSGSGRRARPDPVPVAMIEKATRVAYRFFGILYILIGSGSMLLPTGCLPRALTDRLVQGETLTPFLAHLMQEFGT